MAERAPGFREEQSAPSVTAEAGDLYEMTNIYPRTSGLPVTVWISPRGRARRDARVKVRRVPGNRMIPEDTAVVAVRPEPTLVEGDLDGAVLRAVRDSITLNRDVILAHWDGELDSLEVAQRLRQL
jgi:hypothetical protein